MPKGSAKSWISLASLSRISREPSPGRVDDAAGRPDTKIVWSSPLFSSGRLAWIRHAWQHRQLQPLVCRDTVHELLRVLAYPRFKLSAEQQKELLSDLLPYAEVVTLPVPWPQLPACRDEKDQVFLVLAHVGAAEALVTGDADLLALHD